MEQPEEQGRETLPTTIRAFLQRLFRDPRYLLVDKIERFGRERISFIEACTTISPTGEVRGQALLSREYELTGRPDGERPYGEESLLDFYLRARSGETIALSEGELAGLREESWQYYVRRNFHFLFEDFHRAREDAEHNLGIWNLIDRSDIGEDSKWTYLKWWPWIERDRAMAQALRDVEHDELEQAAAELYRAQRSIEQFGKERAEQYAQEEGDNRELCHHMGQHVAALVELLRRDKDLPISWEEKFDQAAASGDEAEINRLREEMIRRAVDESE